MDFIAIGIWYAIGVLFALTMVLLIGEWWMNAKRRLERLQELPDKPRLRLVKPGMRYYQYGGYRQLDSDGRWHWYELDDEEPPR